MSAEEEIQAGLMNAIERGVSMDKAVQTFINAGYPEAAVRSAARAINEGNVSFSHISDKTEVTPSASAPESPPSPIRISEQVKRIEAVPAEKKEGVSNTKIIILVVILVLLLGVLGASFFFKDQLISLFS